MTLSPSKLSQAKACPGSVRMQQGLASVGNIHSDRGTMLHGIMAEYVLGDGVYPDEYIDLSVEDKEAIDFCVREIEAIGGLFNGAVIHVEHQIDLSFLGIPVVEGRCLFDLAYVLGDNAHFVDYKFGSGWVDHPAYNPQFASYGLGIRKKFGCSNITATKLQPAASENHRVVTHSYLPAELDVWHDRIIDIVKATENPEAMLIPGSQCNFCLANELCPARTKLSVDMPLARTVADYFPTLTAPERGQFYERLLLVKSWIKDAEAGVEKYVLTDGGVVDGFEVGSGRPTRVWADENKALAVMLNLPEAGNVKPEQVVEPVIISPYKAEKLFGKAALEENLKDLIVVEPGKPKVVKCRK